MKGLKFIRNLWTEVTGQEGLLYFLENRTVYCIKIRGQKCRFPLKNDLKNNLKNRDNKWDPLEEFSKELPFGE